MNNSLTRTANAALVFTKMRHRTLLEQLRAVSDRAAAHTAAQAAEQRKTETIRGINVPLRTNVDSAELGTRVLVRKISHRHQCEQLVHWSQERLRRLSKECMELERGLASLVALLGSSSEQTRRLERRLQVSSIHTRLTQDELDANEAQELRVSGADREGGAEWLSTR